MFSLIALVVAIATTTTFALPSFQVFDDAANQLRWRLRAGNGEIVLASEGFTTPSAVTASIDSVRRNAQIAARFKINAASNGEFHVVLTASNGEVIGSGETYSSMSAAMSGITSIQSAASSADRVDKTKAAASNDYSGTFELFNDAAGKIRFRLVSSSGETILQSEAYESMGGALNGIDSVQTNAVIFDRFSYKTASNGQYYFLLTSGNNQVIGHSELYKSLGGRAVGQYAVERAAPTAAIVDLTVAQPVTPKPAEFRLTQDAESGKFTFDLVDPKGQPLLAADNLYVTKQGAQNGIESVRTNAIDETKFVVDLTTSQKRTARFEIYRDLPTGLQYFWRLKSSNSIEILTSPAALADQAAAAAQISLVKGRCVDFANYKNDTAGFKFELVDAAGAAIGNSQTYKSVDGIAGGVASVFNNAPTAVVLIVPWSAPTTQTTTVAATPSPTPPPNSLCAAYVDCDQCISATGASDGPCGFCATTGTAGNCQAGAISACAGTYVAASSGNCPTTPPVTQPPVPSTSEVTFAMITVTPVVALTEPAETTKATSATSLVAPLALVFCAGFVRFFY